MPGPEKVLLCLLFVSGAFLFSGHQTGMFEKDGGSRCKDEREEKENRGETENKNKINALTPFVIV